MNTAESNSIHSDIDSSKEQWDSVSRCNGQYHIESSDKYLSEKADCLLVKSAIIGITFARRLLNKQNHEDEDDEHEISTDHLNMFLLMKTKEDQWHKGDIQ